jgi:hypothetical protein
MKYAFLSSDNSNFCFDIIKYSQFIHYHFLNKKCTRNTITLHTVNDTSTGYLVLYYISGNLVRNYKKLGNVTALNCNNLED